MAVAGAMIAHQIASKAVRDATFLSVWPASALPAIVIATAMLVVVAVPIYARLLARFGPHVVVPIGFFVSAIGHAIEWRLPNGPWLAVLIYLHVAGIGALLLSGFWSLTSELFDPKSARWGYGRIAAAGTIGGLAGGLITARLASVTDPWLSPLLLLAALHVLCAIGLVLMNTTARRQAGLPTETPPDASGVFTLGGLRRAPHLKTLALLILLNTAGAAIADYLLKAEAVRPGGYTTDAELLRFFAVFYTIVQVVTVVLQTAVGPAVRKLGLGRTIAALPTGLGFTSALALLFPTFRMFTVVRGVESVLRGSFFRSGYELIFVPMDPEEKRRTKTFLDVTCDRAGDAVGAMIVQLLLLTSIEFQKAEMLAAVIAIAAGAMYLARRLDVLYLGVVARHLVKHAEPTPIVMGSEAGWTVVNLSVKSGVQPSAPPPRTVAPALVMPRADDPRLRTLADLRSGERRRVDATLSRLGRPDALQIAQVIQLLAWDDVVAAARRVLEANAAAHIGQMVDALVDEDTDFAIRRRLPRILGTLSSERAVVGLMRGLEDTRFEVRYQCARAIDRMLVRGAAPPFDRGRILSAVDRELSVSPQVWHGHQLIDRVEREEGDDRPTVEESRARRNLEHVFTLLSTVLPREPLQVAFHGIQSDDPRLRALAAEYLDGVLPPGIRTRLWTLVDPEVPHAPREHVTMEQTLQELRESAKKAGLG